MTMTRIVQLSHTTVPLERATAAIAAGIATGTSLGVPFTITVIDAGDSWSPRTGWTAPRWPP